ncbi:hypothetical protein [Pseudorhodoferax soli]|nr:hypothetical protein [Pseudorhodoferax soli]
MDSTRSVRSCSWGADGEQQPPQLVGGASADGKDSVVRMEVFDVAAVI